MLFIIEEAKETLWDFSQETVKILCVIEWFNFYQYNMTQYNSLNVKLSNSQLNKLKSAMKNETSSFEIIIKYVW